MSKSAINRIAIVPSAKQILFLCRWEWQGLSEIFRISEMMRLWTRDVLYFTMCNVLFAPNSNCRNARQNNNEQIIVWITGFISCVTPTVHYWCVCLFCDRFSIWKSAFAFDAVHKSQICEGECETVHHFKNSDCSFIWSTVTKSASKNNNNNQLKWKDLHVEYGNRPYGSM